MGRNKIASFAAIVVSTILANHVGAGSTPGDVRCTTWNLEWFPNGSAHDASPEEQDRRIIDAAAVLKPLRPKKETFYCFKKYVTMTHVVVSEMLSNPAHIT